MVNTVPKVEVLACAVCRDFFARLGRLMYRTRKGKIEWVKGGQGGLDTVWGGRVEEEGKTEDVRGEGDKRHSTGVIITPLPRSVS